MTTERKQLIAELWQCMPFYQPGELKTADNCAEVPVELLERVLTALAAPADTVTIEPCTDAAPAADTGVVYDEGFGVVYDAVTLTAPAADSTEAARFCQKCGTRYMERK